MAGGYGHVVQKDGHLRSKGAIEEFLEKDDLFACVEEMYGMIWFLAGVYAYSDPKSAVSDARSQYREGLRMAQKIHQ